MRKKGIKNKVYSAEFKTGVIMDMQEHRLGYREMSIVEYVDPFTGQQVKEGK